MRTYRLNPASQCWCEVCSVEGTRVGRYGRAREPGEGGIEVNQLDQLGRDLPRRPDNPRSTDHQRSPRRVFKISCEWVGRHIVSGQRETSAINSIEARVWAHPVLYGKKGWGIHGFLELTEFVPQITLSKTPAMITVEDHDCVVPKAECIQLVQDTAHLKSRPIVSHELIASKEVGDFSFHKADTEGIPQVLWECTRLAPSAWRELHRLSRSQTALKKTDPLT
jgi:hypothetical protein